MYNKNLFNITVHSLTWHIWKLKHDGLQNEYWEKHMEVTIEQKLAVKQYLNSFK